MEDYSSHCSVDELLIQATWIGDVAAMRELLQQGANVHFRDANFHTALWNAIFEHQLEAARFLFEHGGVDINSRDDDRTGNTPLHWACSEDQLAFAQYLIERNANVNAQNYKGETPLHVYAFVDLDIVRLLIANGADVNATDKLGQRPLHRACCLGFFNVVRYLMENGAEANPMSYRRTPLMLACKRSDLAIAQVVIDNGGNVDEEDGDQGRTALHVACSEGRLEVAKFLKANNAKINTCDRHGDSPLHSAQYTRHWEVFKFLVENGAEVNDTNHEDATALHAASWQGSLEAVKLLVSYGARVNLVDALHGTTPLHVAAVQGHWEISKVLIENGAEVNAQEDDGYTPLHMACYNGHWHVVHLLLGRAANVKATTKEGKTPLQIATERNRQDAVWVLVRQHPSLVV